MDVALEVAHQARRLAESRRTAYAVFRSRVSVDLVPTDGKRYARLMEDPSRACHELAVVRPDSCVDYTAAVLRDAGV